MGTTKTSLGGTASTRYICIALAAVVAFGMLGCARYDFFGFYTENSVKSSDAEKHAPGGEADAGRDDRRDGGRDDAFDDGGAVHADLGWMRTSHPVSYEELGGRMGLDPSKIADLNWDTVDSTVPSGRLVLIPLSNSEILKNVSDDDLLGIRATVLEDSYRYAEESAPADDEGARFVAKNIREIAGSKSIDPNTLGEKYARLIGRTVADATVEYAKKTPWINTLEVEYKLPIGSDVATVSADALIALHELDEDGRFVFTQVGGRYKKDRFMGNLGIGYRQLSQDKSWMWGGNAFLDYDFMGEHARGGLGAEIKTSLLDFYSNYYLPVTPWKKAYGNHYLEERAARGFDAGLVGRLPFLQSVDWNAKYFKWYGNRVDVYGDNKYLSDPDGVEIGATWTPWKAFKLGLAHSRVIGSSLQETRVEGTFSATFEELGSLFDSTKVSEGTAVKERMGQLVTRQNEIVFERRVSAEGQAAGIVITKFQRN